MAETEFVDAEDCSKRLNSTLQKVKHLEECLQKTENQMDNLQKEYTKLEKKYFQVCAENKTLNSKLLKKMEQEKEQRAREEAKKDR